MLASNIKKNVFVAISAVCLFATILPAVMLEGGILFTLVELLIVSKVLGREVLAHEDLEFFKANGMGARDVQKFQSIFPIK